jgi:hypothetical protein
LGGRRLPAFPSVGQVELFSQSASLRAQTNSGQEGVKRQHPLTLPHPRIEPEHCVCATKGASRYFATSLFFDPVRQFRYQSGISDSTLPEAAMKFLTRFLLVLLALYGLVFYIGDLYLAKAGGLIVFQYLVGLWMIEWLIDISWADLRTGLPEANRQFVERRCAERFGRDLHAPVLSYR